MTDFQRSFDPQHAADDCAAMVARLQYFLDGELTDERRAAIQGHLDLCPSCFGAFDFEAELRIVVRSRLQSTVPPTLMQRVLAACRAEPPSTGGFAQGVPFGQSPVGLGQTPPLGATSGFPRASTPNEWLAPGAGPVSAPSS